MMESNERGIRGFFRFKWVKVSVRQVGFFYTSFSFHLFQMPNHLHIRCAHLILRRRRRMPFTPLQRVNEEGVCLLCVELFIGRLGVFLGRLALKCT